MKNEEEIDLKQSFDDDDDMGLQRIDDEAFSDVEVEDDLAGFGVEDAPEDDLELDDEGGQNADFGLDDILDDDLDAEEDL